MSIFTPTSNWSEIQERTIDPQSKYDSDIINQITAVGGGDRYKVTGLLADLVYDTDDNIPYLHITSGIAVKDYVVIQFTDESYVSFGGTWPISQGNYYLAIYYKYEKQTPPPQAELRFITETEYDPEYYFPLYKIVITGTVFPDDVYIEQLEFGKDENKEYYIETLTSEYQYVSESGGETSIDISEYYNEYTKEYAVYINGIYQREGTNYTIDSIEEKIILNAPLAINDSLVFISRQWGRPNTELSPYSQEKLDNGVLDTRYYTETEIDNFFEGEDTGKKQVDWARVLNTPTTIDGYGITDGVTNTKLIEHNDTTINVHGIADTSDLALKSGSVNQFSDITSLGTEIEDAVAKKHDQNTDIGTNSNTFQIGTNGPIIKNNIGNLQLRNNLDSDYVNLEVSNLTVHGTTTTLYTEEVTIDDNILLLNSNVTGTPTENAGLEIERGDLDNVKIIWDETNLLWKAGFTGSEKTVIREDDMITLSGQVNGSGTFNSDGIASIVTTVDTSTVVTFENLDANGDVGTGSSQVAQGDHTHALDDISDVTAASVINGEVLVYDAFSTNWVNKTLAEAGIETPADVQAKIDAHANRTDNPHNVTASQLGADNILSQIKTVDGSGSGLDADLLDGLDSTAFVTKSILTTKGDMYIRDGSSVTRLPVGTDNQVLTADSTQVSGVKWDTRLANIVEDTTPELGGELDAGEHTIGFTERSNTSSAGAVTIDWTKSNHQAITLTENTTFTFTNPTNPCNLTLRIKQDSVGGWTVTMPTLKTPSGIGVSFSTAANTEDLMMLYFDGVNYIATVLQDVK